MRAVYKARGSKQSEMHPYMRIKFWINQDNWFWETGMYSEKTKQYYRNWVNQMISNENNMAILDPSLT